MTKILRYRIQPRILQDVSSLDTRVQLYGEWVEFPICAAPTSLQKMAHPEGEGATARGSYNNTYTVNVPSTLKKLY